MKLTCVAFSALALAGAAATASAGIITESAPFAFPVSPGSATVFLPQFDTLGGTRDLVRVTLEVQGQVSGRVTIENDSTISGVFRVRFDGLVQASAMSLNPSAVLTMVTPDVVLSPSDGVNGTGPDFVDFGTLFADAASSMTTLDPIAMAPFLGTGSVGVFSQGTASYSVQGTTDSVVRVRDLHVSGTAVVTYEFVPTPGSACLLVIGGLVAARRRR